MFRLFVEITLVLTVIAWVFAKALVEVGRWLDERKAAKDRRPVAPTKGGNHRMNAWVTALFSELFPSIWWIVSALSTLTTFFVPALAGKPRVALTISTLLGFGYANFRVFQKQESRILSLTQKLASHETRIAQLKITCDNGSRYILAPVGNVPYADFKGIFLEFHLMIENTGRKNSIIDNYQVEIAELHRSFPGLRPLEGPSILVRGRHCQHALAPGQILNSTGTIHVDAENATKHGILLFSVPGVDLEQFVKVGLRMEGEARKFGTLHCRLTLTDTAQSSVTQEFHMYED